MNTTSKGAERDCSEENPPVFGTWKRLYSLVLVYVFVLIAALCAITALLAY